MKEISSGQQKRIQTQAMQGKKEQRAMENVAMLINLNEH
jgi:hypothetical protein